jgi:uncharacterized membrane protein YsdA (DUF1294 family)/cold shock CspA family protein
MKSIIQKGKLITWKDDRGFGFIQPEDGGQEVFIHISKLKNANRRPQVGDIICYRLAADKDGKVSASRAFISTATAQPSVDNSKSRANIKVKSNPKFSGWMSQTILLSVIPMWGAIHFALMTANPIPAIGYIVMSSFTFYLYAEDKSLAQQGKWRISEQTLHLFEFAGGWIGAFIAQRKLRHKNRKGSYQAIFWIIVIVHLLVWLDWLFLGGMTMKILLDRVSRK